MKQFIITGLMFIILNNSIAQKVEFRIGGGYHFSAGSQYFLENVENALNNYTRKSVEASLGMGLQLMTGADYSIKKWLSVTLDINYFQNIPSIKGIEKSSYISDYLYTSETKWKSTLLLISPGIKLNITDSKLNMYSKLSIVLPLFSSVKLASNYQVSSFVGFSKGSSEQTFKLKNTIGYRAAFGIAPMLSKKVSYFAEIAIQTLSIQAKKSTLESDVVNGVEKIGTYSIYQKEKVYVKELSNEPYNSNQPQKLLGFSLPYSSIGINVGLCFKL